MLCDFGQRVYVGVVMTTAKLVIFCEALRYDRAAQGCQWLRTQPASGGDLRDVGAIPGSGRSPREGNGNPFQYTCLENPLDRGTWRATVHGVARVKHDLAT